VDNDITYPALIDDMIDNNRIIDANASIEDFEEEYDAVFDIGHGKVEEQVPFKIEVKGLDKKWSKWIKSEEE